MTPRLPRARVVLLAVAMAVGGAGCDDEVEGSEALTGSLPGLERWVVTFAGDGPDLSEYREAEKKGAEARDAVVLKLRQQAAVKRAAFGQKLAAFGGRVVDYWWLTNAVTIEIPAGSVASLREAGLEGVTSIEPDRPLE